MRDTGEQVTVNMQPNDDTTAVLRRDFPQCFDSRGEFDIEAFKRTVSETDVDFSRESYSLDWLGKGYARVRATDAATTLLQEDVEWNNKPENKDSQNLLIKGDNLEVLKHLSHAYHERVKMIYIDPPYNTGSDGFVYEDDRKFTVAEFAALAGVEVEHAKRIMDFVDSKSNSHSAWLTFMYPRLYIARQLLRDDGVIFVSIDDNEVAQLRILMNEIFGEQYVEQYIWDLADFEESSFTKTASNSVRKEHEYVLAAFKAPPVLGRYTEYRFKERNDFENADNDERGAWMSGNISRNGITSTTGSKYFTIVTPTGQEYTRNWTVTKEEFEGLKSDNRIFFSREGDGVPRLKIFKNEPSNSIQSSLLKGLKTSITGKNEIKSLFEGIDVFSFPKPTNLIKRFVELTTKDGDTVLDFFSGSGPTAQAVMQQNAEDGKERKYILVQLPEIIDGEKDKVSYDFVKNVLGVPEPTIFDITRERLVRAAAKIKVDKAGGEHLASVDFGFKIFGTTPIWEDYDVELDAYDPTAQLFDVALLTPVDISTLLTTWKTYDGVALTESLSPVNFAGYTAHYGAGKLYLMDSGFTAEHLRALLNAIDSDRDFSPNTIVLFGYHFESARIREIIENVKSYANKKSIDIECVTRY